MMRPPGEGYGSIDRFFVLVIDLYIWVVIASAHPELARRLQCGEHQQSVVLVIGEHALPADRAGAPADPRICPISAASTSRR